MPSQPRRSYQGARRNIIFIANLKKHCLQRNSVWLFAPPARWNHVSLHNDEYLSSCQAIHDIKLKFVLARSFKLCMMIASIELCTVKCHATSQPCFLNAGSHPCCGWITVMPVLVTLTLCGQPAGQWVRWRPGHHLGSLPAPLCSHHPHGAPGKHLLCQGDTPHPANLILLLLELI